MKAGGGVVPFFPALRPNELLYSAISRFHQESRSGSVRATRETLFGTSRGPLSLQLPSGLDQLADRIPGAPPGFASDLLWDHTLFGFYAPLTPPDRVQMAHQALRSLNANKAATMLGAIQNTSAQRRLRFCALCAQRDSEHFGTPHWSRLHQAPGITFCSEHQIPLWEAPLALRGHGPDSQFRPLDHELIAASTEIQVERDEELLLHLANEATWLLENARNLPPRDDLFLSYRDILDKRGWVTATGWILLDSLEESMRKHYHEGTLRMLGIDIPSTEWITRLFGPAKLKSHPLRQILVLAFLGTSVQSLFQLGQEDLFGSMTPQPLFAGRPGPATTPRERPCLNPVCTSSTHRQRRNRAIDRLGFGTRVRCPDCGYEYERYAKGISVIHFGRPFLSRLASMLNDPNTDLQDIKRELRLRDGSLTRAVQEATGKTLKAIQESQLLERRRQRVASARTWLLNSISDDPSRCRTDLQRLDPKAFAYLRTHDWNWLEQHAPRKRRRQPNLDVIDEQLLERLPAALARASRRSPRVKASLNALAQELGRSELTEAAAYRKYPRTLAAIRTALGEPAWPSRQ